MTWSTGWPTGKYGTLAERTDIVWIAPSHQLYNSNTRHWHDSFALKKVIKELQTPSWPIDSLSVGGIRWQGWAKFSDLSKPGNSWAAVKLSIYQDRASRIM